MKTRLLVNRLLSVVQQAETSFVRRGPTPEVEFSKLIRMISAPTIDKKSPKSRLITFSQLNTHLSTTCLLNDGFIFLIIIFFGSLPNYTMMFIGKALKRIRNNYC